MSHKGLIWHNGQWKIYTKPFRENRSTLIGCLYDGKQGTLTYFKDGENLGVAFTGLNLVKHYLYPTVCSTAAKTEFIITFCRRDYINLQDRWIQKPSLVVSLCNLILLLRCRNIIRNRINLQHDVDKLNIPKPILSYLKLEEEDERAARYEIEFCKYRLKMKNRTKQVQSTKIPMPDF